MKFIVDTHIFLWSLSDPGRIDKPRRVEIMRRSNKVLVSSISIAEIMIKASLGKLKVDFDPLDMIEKSGFESLDFSVSDAILLKDLPFHHKDPFDRMLISQSISAGIPLMTDDPEFRRYGCELI
ncbi:MAG: type II toxin-antitoxin system VapC family toxin [Victivallales bacterium]|nr:type II toxin-antitoxin system VapC family toxin [Victivallales bacterium]